MRRVLSSPASMWVRLTLVAVVVAVAGRGAMGQGPLSVPKPVPKPAAAETAEAAPAAEAAAAEEEKVFRGRLPAYYGHVVDEEQRAAIYEIQKQYAPRIDALKAQLAALTEERNAKVAAVLTPEQQAKVASLKAEAKAKRDLKAAQEKAATSKPPAATPPATTSE